MDNPVTESNEPLDVHESLMSLLGDDGALNEEPAAEPTEEPAEIPAEASETPAELPASAELDLIDTEYEGKTYKVPKEIKDALLRQSDYTKKTMEVAEQRKAIEAERNAYTQNLNVLAAQLQNAVAQDQNIDWNALLENDPVEYLRQKEAATQRAQALQAAQFEQQRVLQQHESERQTQLQSFLKEQRDHLLAKLPEWKDEAKAKTEQSELKAFLASNGLNDQEISGIADHRMILLARKAMLYDKTVRNADLSAKRLQNLPPKVERPGAAAPAPDKAQQAIARSRRTGRTEDAAAAIAQLL